MKIICEENGIDFRKLHLFINELNASGKIPTDTSRQETIEAILTELEKKVREEDGNENTEFIDKFFKHVSVISKEDEHMLV